MKYTQEQYNTEVISFKNLIHKCKLEQQSLLDRMRLILYNSNEWRDIEHEIALLETQLKEFQKEHYSDFRVYTNNERQLATRIDGAGMLHKGSLLQGFI